MDSAGGCAVPAASAGCPGAATRAGRTTARATASVPPPAGSLAAAPDSSYDYIVLDAFSSDAIPVHLMTREALALYKRKLAPGGSIAFHVSNRYLNLEPVLVELSRDARMAGIVGADTGITPEQSMSFKMNSKWIVLSRNANDHAELALQPGWRVLAPKADVALWTDDFSNVFSVFRW